MSVYIMGVCSDCPKIMKTVIAMLSAVKKANIMHRNIRRVSSIVTFRPCRSVSNFGAGVGITASMPFLLKVAMAARAAM